MEGYRRGENSLKGPAHSGETTSVLRTITVHASSEVSCPPDSFSLAISVTSTKDSAEAAQNSVNRRTEYILQVLRNNSIKGKQVKKSTDVTRVNEDEVCVRVCISVQTGSLEACEAARNVLIEKMDATVQCSTIDLLHSPAHKTEKKNQAFKEAVISAKQKALSVANTLEVQLGPAVKVDEKPHCETDATSQDTVRQSSLPPIARNTDPSFMPPPSLHEQLKMSTEIFTSTVEVTFEVSPLRICHHHKCPKH